MLHNSKCRFLCIKHVGGITLIVAPPRKMNKPSLTSKLINMKSWRKRSSNSSQKIFFTASSLKFFAASFTFVFTISQMKCKNKKHLHVFLCFKECFFHFKMVSHYRRGWIQMEVPGKKTERARKKQNLKLLWKAKEKMKNKGKSIWIYIWRLCVHCFHHALFYLAFFTAYSFAVW